MAWNPLNGLHEPTAVLLGILLLHGLREPQPALTGVFRTVRQLVAAQGASFPGRGGMRWRLQHILPICQPVSPLFHHPECGDSPSFI